MAEANDLGGEVMAALDGSPPVSRRDQDMARAAARRVEAINLRLYGLTWAEIGARLDISEDGARDLVLRTLERAENVAVDSLRELENQRLDRAQLAIWTKVLQGDLKAIDAFLRISSARRQMNGLNAPQKVEVNMQIRHEMERALNELEGLVLRGEVVPDPVDLTNGFDGPASPMLPELEPYANNPHADGFGVSIVRESDPEQPRYAEERR